MPLSSPEHLNGTEDNVDDIWSEEPPSDMTEMALTEELHQVQVQRYELLVPKRHNIFSLLVISPKEQASNVRTQLNEEELKNSKLLQQISKLEEQISVIAQECAQKEQVLIFVLSLIFRITVIES